MAEDNQNHTYDDIINLPNPTSKNHPRMPLYDRAAQFSPFAALTGHDAAIAETARLTDKKAVLDEDALAKLNKRLRIIGENLETEPQVTITYFVLDNKKAGGAYFTHTGIAKRIDEYEHVVIMKDKTVIPIDEISSIESEIFRDMELYE